MKQIVLAAFLMFTNPFASVLFAAPVYIGGQDKDRGQAFTFSYQGNCYALLPKHVVRRKLFNLKSGIPEKEGNGEILLRLHDDLALASVTGPLASQCGQDWKKLPRSLDPGLLRAGSGFLEESRSSGLIQRIPVSISPVEYDYLGISPREEKWRNRLGKGRSGALLTVNSRPVGIAIELPSENEHFPAEVRVMRLDAIVGRLDRFLNGRQLAYSTTSANRDNQSRETSSLEFTVDSWNASPFTPENSPKNLEAPNAQAVLFKPLERYLALDIKLAGDAASVVREIKLKASNSNAGFTIPKQIAIYAGRREGKNQKSVLKKGEMSPTGEFSIKFSPQRMRWIFIRVNSVWDANKPVRIDKLTIR